MHTNSRIAPGSPDAPAWFTPPWKKQLLIAEEGARPLPRDFYSSALVLEHRADGAFRVLRSQVPGIPHGATLTTTDGDTRAPR